MKDTSIIIVVDNIFFEIFGKCFDVLVEKIWAFLKRRIPFKIVEFVLNNCNKLKNVNIEKFRTQKDV